MTFTQPMSFGKLFEYFFRYWGLVRRTGVDLTVLEVSVMTCMIYAYLKNDWLKNEWGLRELDFFAEE